MNTKLLALFTLLSVPAFAETKVPYVYTDNKIAFELRNCAYNAGTAIADRWEQLAKQYKLAGNLLVQQKDESTYAVEVLSVVDEKPTDIIFEVKTNVNCEAVSYRHEKETRVIALPTMNLPRERVQYDCRTVSVSNNPENFEYYLGAKFQLAIGGGERIGAFVVTHRDGSVTAATMSANGEALTEARSPKSDLGFEVAELNGHSWAYFVVLPKVAAKAPKTMSVQFWEDDDGILGFDARLQCERVR